MSNSIDPDEKAHMSRLIWIYAVCKSLLLSPVAVKELNKEGNLHGGVFFLFFWWVVEETALNKSF